MALRDQPYLPLYVQDVLTDEKLIECSAQSHGVYFLLLCLLHKQEKYGLICLKEKYKQIQSKTEAFASMLAKQMPFEQKQIQNCLDELLHEKVITIDGFELYQKRMVKDGELSIMRTEAGKMGGSSVTKQYGKAGTLYLMSDGYAKNKIGISVNPLNRLYRLRSDLKLPRHFEIKDTIIVSDMGKSEDYAQKFFSDIIDGEWLICNYEEALKKFALLKANIKANTESETVNENKDEISILNALKLKPKKAIPDLSEFLEYCKSVYEDELKKDFAPFEFAVKSKYESWVVAGWKDGNNKAIKNWKSKIKNTIPFLKPTSYTEKHELSKAETIINNANAVSAKFLNQDK